MITLNTLTHNEILRGTLDRWAGPLVELSHSLHAEPELAHAEHRSCAKASALADAAGFDVQTPIAGLPTAFVADYGSGELTVAFCVEYDALPGLGHACGHNVNAAATLGAAMALTEVADRVGMRLRVIGTPAEESDGGKITLLDAGVFDDTHLAMMVHAGGADEVGGSSLAMTQWRIEFSGAPAHAAAAPWAGVNALDGFTLAYQAIGLLRQQLEPGSVVSCIVDDGGSAVNVIPERCRAQVEMRAPTIEALRRLKTRVRACFDGAAIATATQVFVTECGGDFADLRQDDDLTQAYAAALHQLGRHPISRAGEYIASTDMGNVSHRVPSIHPTIGYDVAGAAHHTAEFAAHGVTASADAAVVDGAHALALTALHAATDPGLRVRLLSRTPGRS